MLDKAERLNTFRDPLPLSEIRATARSTAKWTWGKYTGRATPESRAADGLTPEIFALVQSNLGKMAMAKRWGDNSDKKAQAAKMAASGLVQAEIAKQLE